MTRTQPLPVARPRPAPAGPSRRAPVAIGAVPGALALALALAVGLGACSSDAPSPEETGRQARAVTVLRDFGLTEDQAECIADELGADTVVEAASMDTLAAGQQYQDAAKACIK